MEVAPSSNLLNLVYRVYAFFCTADEFEMNEIKKVQMDADLWSWKPSSKTNSAHSSWKQSSSRTRTKNLKKM